MPHRTTEMDRIDAAAKAQREHEHAIRTSPTSELHAALIDAGARCLAIVDGPNTTGPTASELEFWAVGSNERSHLVIVQRWTRAGNTFSYYLEGQRMLTEEAIRDILKGTQP